MSAPSVSAEKPRVYFSFDIEADGGSPACNSMVSFGCVVFDERGQEVDKLQANLEPLPEQTVDKRCKEEFWDKYPEIAAFVKTNTVDPTDFIASLMRLVNKYTGAGNNIVWVANPAAYDWQWLRAYYSWFKNAEDPDIGYSAKCIGTMLEVLRWRYEWTDDEADAYEEAQMLKLREKDHIAHNPEHDARVQGKWFFKLRDLAASRKRVCLVAQTKIKRARVQDSTPAHPVVAECGTVLPLTKRGMTEAEYEAMKQTPAIQ